MGYGFSIALGIWTGILLSAFLVVAIGAMTQPTCGAFSQNPCPELEFMLALGVGVVLLVIWAVGVVALLLISWFANWVRGLPD